MAQLEDLSGWDEAFVVALSTDEQSWLDFKASAWLTSPEFTDKLSHYVSAFANYDGGYLVIGVGARTAGAPVEIDGGVPLAYKKKLRDWLEMTVRQAVEPPLEQLSVALISPGKDGSRIQPKHAVVAIHVPPSEAAPHQARDKKYYSRVGSHLNPLGNRAVMDIVGRRRHPRTAVRLFLGLTRNPNKNTLICRVENRGARLARHVLTIVDVPIKIDGIGVRFEESDLKFDEDGTAYWQLRARSRVNEVLFPDGYISHEFKFRFTGAWREETTQGTRQVALDQTIPRLRYRSYADEMPFLAGEVDPAEIITRADIY